MGSKCLAVTVEAVQKISPTVFGWGFGGYLHYLWLDEMTQGGYSLALEADLTTELNLTITQLLPFHYLFEAVCAQVVSALELYVWVRR